MPRRLIDDHSDAARLAEAFSEEDLEEVQTVWLMDQEEGDAAAEPDASMAGEEEPRPEKRKRAKKAR